MDIKELIHKALGYNYWKDTPTNDFRIGPMHRTFSYFFQKLRIKYRYRENPAAREYHYIDRVVVFYREKKTENKLSLSIILSFEDSVKNYQHEVEIFKLENAPPRLAQDFIRRSIKKIKNYVSELKTGAFV